ncbi:MAG: DegV family protein [Anaerolineaceae bacterium]|jgi:DegV family protein with EDD domain
MKNRKVAVVTDGACSLAPAQGEQLGVHIAPVYITFEEETFRAGIDLDDEGFYRLLRASKKLPTTAQPTVADFLKLYEKIAEEAEEIVTIVISHHMSATLQSAEMAKEQFDKVPVHIIDSESVSLGLGMMAIAAARAAEEGLDARAVLDLVENIKQKINVIFTVNTLEYLHKGGRIGGGTAFLGAALDIRPILYIKDGRIEPLERQRTRKRSISRMVEIMEQKVGKKPVHVAILHGNVPEESHQLEQTIRSKFDCVEILNSDMGPVIGVHAGPGTLGLVFYTSD